MKKELAELCWDFIFTIEDEPEKKQVCEKEILEYCWNDFASLPDSP